MAYLICTECNKTNPDTLENCIFCNASLRTGNEQITDSINTKPRPKITLNIPKDTQMILNGISYDAKDLYIALEKFKNKQLYKTSLKGVVLRKEAEYKLSSKGISQLANYIIEQLEIPKYFVAQTQEEYLKEQLKPRCPKCGSTSITAGARGANALFGFMGASKTVNRCSNCGNTWTPRGK